MSRVLKDVASVAHRVTEIPVTRVVTESPSAPLESSESHPLQRPQDILDEARQTCSEMLTEARAEGQRIVDEAKNQSIQLQEAAETKGYEDGFAAGQEAATKAARQFMDEQTALAEDIVGKARQRYEEALLSLHTVVSGIVADALQTLLQRELNLEPADIEAVVKTMMEAVVEGSRIEIRVHPEDFDTANSQHGTWLTHSLGEWQVSVVPDGDITRGGCIIQTPHGRADGRLETRLELVQAKLAQFFEGGALDELEAEGSARTE